MRVYVCVHVYVYVSEMLHRIIHDGWVHSDSVLHVPNRNHSQDLLVRHRHIDPCRLRNADFSKCVLQHRSWPTSHFAMLIFQMFRSTSDVPKSIFWVSAWPGISRSPTASIGAGYSTSLDTRRRCVTRLWVGYRTVALNYVRNNMLFIRFIYDSVGTSICLFNVMKTFHKLNNDLPSAFCRGLLPRLRRLLRRLLHHWLGLLRELLLLPLDLVLLQLLPKACPNHQRPWSFLILKSPERRLLLICASSVRPWSSLTRAGHWTALRT